MKKVVGVGDKVRVIKTREGANIIKVLSANEAVIDTFDGDLKVEASEVIFYKGGDAAGDDEAVIFLPSKERKQKPLEVQPLRFDQEKRSKFSYKLDLHAERLIGNTDDRSNEEILSIQLSRLKSYITDAVELRIQRVYIVHGIGSGRLKSEDHYILHNMKDVKSFKNDYHPDHGMGATEVILR